MFDTQTAGAFSCCKVYGCCCKQQEHVKWYFSGYIKQKLVAFTGSRDKKADERKGKNLRFGQHELYVYRNVLFLQKRPYRN